MLESLHEAFVVFSEYAILIIQAMAALFVVVGAIRGFIGGIRALFVPETGHERREIWLRFARYLVAALTLQLAADILETAIRADWVSIGHLGAVAVIRTFLNYFLERDLRDLREEDRKLMRERADSATRA